MVRQIVYTVIFFNQRDGFARLAISFPSGAVRWSSTMPTFGWTSRTQILAPWSLRVRRRGGQVFWVTTTRWFPTLFFGCVSNCISLSLPFILQEKTRNLEKFRVYSGGKNIFLRSKLEEISNETVLKITPQKQFERVSNRHNKWFVILWWWLIAQG